MSDPDTGQLSRTTADGDVRGGAWGCPHSHSHYKSEHDEMSHVPESGAWLLRFDRAFR